MLRSRCYRLTGMVLTLMYSLLITAGSLAHAASTAPPAEGVDVTFNGLPFVPATDEPRTAPFIQDGVTMVPIRAAAENLGGRILWDESSQTTSLQVGDNQMVFKIGSNIVDIDDHSIEMPAPARINKGTTFVPLRTVSEQFGVKLTWSAQQQRIDLTYRPRPKTLAKFEPNDGIYLGAYIQADNVVKGDISLFNEMTNKHHASFFMYLGYGQPFPTAWVEEVKRAGAFPQIAFEPNDGLDVVQDDQYLRDWAKAAKQSGVPILLRFASEMNGKWSAYSGDPDKFIKKWRMVHDVMEKEAPNVAMMWSVFTFPQRNIPLYYPGKDYVDWVGVNVYNVIYHNGDLNHVATDEDPLELIRYVYNLYSGDHPIAISEFGATHLTGTDNFVDHSSYAMDKITRMYTQLHDTYPRLKAIYYYDVNNLKYAPEGRKINDYSLTNQLDVLNAYRHAIAPDYFLSSPPGVKDYSDTSGPRIQ